jgi:asparagine synthase (glutamine-hydrolysing)
MRAERRIDKRILDGMTSTLVHRGPDSKGRFLDKNIGLGVRRLSIIDLAGGDQPIFNEDDSVVLVCNGEIFNYKALGEELTKRGHVFRTQSDVEPLLHLYEEHKAEFLNRINGQFAFALYDRKQEQLLLARDHFGINPLFFAVADGFFVFGSEIKALLAHPSVARQVDLTGLDQVFTFPGMVSPHTLFRDVKSLKSGHYVTVSKADVRVREYWDLDYPLQNDEPQPEPEGYYAECLKELLLRSVSYRLQADVPVGFYLSGGLDSSIIASAIQHVSPMVKRRSFSITFSDRSMSEQGYQRLMSEWSDSEHHEIEFDASDVATHLTRMVYHSECPVKETYNTCSLLLSGAARDAGVPVVLTGEGADELFAGYVGYKFDKFEAMRATKSRTVSYLEEELRNRLWGDGNLLYEKHHYGLSELKRSLYSASVNEMFDDFDCANHWVVNKERLKGRSRVHQRSYLDLKLRMADHLLSDHGDRMALANSVEARYPFLDKDLVEFATTIPPHLKLNEFTEKYILKKMATGMIPAEIVNREKFGFRAPGGPALLAEDSPWINDMLSYDRIKRQGYFNPDAVENLKSQYQQEGFKLNIPYEDDLLVIVLTFGIAMDLFHLPAFG